MGGRGKKSDLDFTIGTNAEKALNDMTKIISKQDGIIRKTRQSAAEAKKAMRAMQKAHKAQIKAAEKSAKATGKVKKELKGVSTAAVQTGPSIKTMIGAFGGLSAVVVGIRAVSTAMEELKDLRSEMLEKAEGVEATSLKLAHLRKDVSQKGLTNVQNDIEAVAKNSHVSLDVASKNLFYSESSFEPGSAAAITSAVSISDFGGAAGLTPEEGKGLPKLFAAFEADTKEEQMVILNQLVAGTGGSSAETGEYLEPLIGLATVYKEMGFTFEQTLGRMTASIEVSGSISKAAEDARRFAEITSGRRTEKGMDFLIAEAKKDGLDFTKMSVPERVDFFTENVYDDYAKSDRLDELSLVLGGESFKVVQLGASDTARKKYENIMPKLAEAKDSTYVQDMSADYANTKTAKRIDREIKTTMAEARSGEETEASTALNEIVDEIFKLDYKRQGLTARIASSIIPDTLEKHGITKMFISKNLRLANKNLMPEKGSDEWNALSSYEKHKYGAMLNVNRSILSYSTNPEFVRKAYEATEGFTMIDKYGTSKDTRWSGSWGRAIGEYEGIGKGAPLMPWLHPEGGRSGQNTAPADPQDLKDHTEALKKNADATEKLTEALTTTLHRSPEFSTPDGGLD